MMVLTLHSAQACEHSKIFLNFRVYLLTDFQKALLFQVFLCCFSLFHPFRVFFAWKNRQTMSFAINYSWINLWTYLIWTENLWENVFRALSTTVGKFNLPNNNTAFWNEFQNKTLYFGEEEKKVVKKNRHVKYLPCAIVLGADTVKWCFRVNGVYLQANDKKKSVTHFPSIKHNTITIIIIYE